MKKILIITAILTLIGAAAPIPLHRWLFELRPGEQLIYFDDNGRIRQLTFIDAVPNGYAMVCRIHESDYDLHQDIYGEPTRHGYRPTLKQNYFVEMNWTPDTYQIYHGAYWAEEKGVPWIGCYAAGEDPILLTFSTEEYSKMPMEIKIRD